MKRIGFVILGLLLPFTLNEVLRVPLYELVYHIEVAPRSYVIR